MRSSMYSMKKNKSNSTLLFLLFLLFLSIPSEAQLLGKVVNKARKITSKVKITSLDGTTPISTSIKDTLYGIDWFDDSMFDIETAKEIGTSVIGPGYYKSTLRSYCLKAGVYGPTKGDGYQIAKLKGSKAKMIHAILKKSVKHPNISQSSVQTLIWGIEAGTQFSKFPLSFQKNVRPLLTEKEMLSMEIDFDHIKNKILPKKIRSLTKTCAYLRKKMQSTQMQYAEIEAIAVKTGVPSLGIGSKEIHNGLWSYIGNSFFLRTSPQSYATTDVELYRPFSLDIKKDDKGRITEVSNNENTLIVSYDDTFGAGVFDYTHTKVPVWKIKNIRLLDTKSKKDTVLSLNQWIFRGPWKKIDLVIGAKNYRSSKEYKHQTDIKGGPSCYKVNFYSIQKDKEQPPLEEIYTTGEKIRTWIDKYKKYIDDYKNTRDEVKDLSTIHNPDYYSDPGFYEKMVAEGIHAATSYDRSKQGKWTRKLSKMIRDMYYYTMCKLMGGCNDNMPTDPDFESYTAQPGNTSKQRLGLSQYRK